MRGWNGPHVEIPVAPQTLNKPHTPQWNKTHLRSGKGNRLNFWYISLKSGYRLNAMYVLKKQKTNLFLKKPGFQMIALSSSEQSLNDYTWGKRGWPCSHPCWFTSLKTTFDFTSFNVQGAHVRYIKILTYSEALDAKFPFFSRLSCLVIPRRDLNTKKTKLNVWKNEQNASESC